MQKLNSDAAHLHPESGALGVAGRPAAPPRPLLRAVPRQQISDAASAQCLHVLLPDAARMAPPGHPARP